MRYISKGFESSPNGIRIRIRTHACTVHTYNHEISVLDIKPRNLWLGSMVIRA